MTQETSTLHGIAASSTEETLLASMIQWLLRQPWRLILLSGVLLLLLSFLLVVLICCVRYRRKRGSMEIGPSHDKDEDQSVAESLSRQDTPSGEHTRLMTVERSDSCRVECQVPDDSEPKREEAEEEEKEEEGKRHSTSFSLENPNDPKPFVIAAETPQSRARKRSRDVSYIQVDILPVAQRAEGKIIPPEERTEYADIAGLLNLFPK